MQEGSLREQGSLEGYPAVAQYANRGHGQWSGPVPDVKASENCATSGLEAYGAMCGDQGTGPALAEVCKVIYDKSARDLPELKPLPGD